MREILSHASDHSSVVGIHLSALTSASRDSPLHPSSSDVLYKFESFISLFYSKTLNILGIDSFFSTLYRLYLICPHFRRQPPLLDRELDSLRSSFLDVDKEPNDDTGSYAVDKPEYQLLITMIKMEEGIAYRKMNACQLFPVLAMIAAQMLGPTSELTRLKIPNKPTRPASALD